MTFGRSRVLLLVAAAGIAGGACAGGDEVKACTFNGNQQAAPFDSGSGDNGLTSWIPTESWKFFTQF